MLIEISLGSGLKGLENLEKKLDSVANSFAGVTKFIKKYGEDLSVAKLRLKDYQKNLGSVRALHEKLKTSQQALRIQQQKETEAVAEAVLAYEKAALRLEDLRVKDLKTTAGKKKLTQASKNAATAQKALTAAQDAAGVKSGKLKVKYDETSVAFKKLTKEINLGGETLAKIDRRTGKTIVQWKKIDQRIEDVRIEYRKLTKAMRATEKQSTRTAKAQDRVQSEFKQTTAAVKRSGREFEIWTDQRLSSDAIPALRRRLGALRNQLLVLAFATRGLKRLFDTAFNASLQLESALKGLGSVAVNTGAGMQAAQEAALNLAVKGLLTVAEAAAGLKNLLSAGFGLPEAIKLMNTLTDSASFNRQGTLALGEAVVGATQGIKNQNSIMVDNAGITKNLSIMYKEYAASIGTTMGVLTELEKRQAIYNGIQKEGAIFAGDSEKVLSTLSGRLSVLSAKTIIAAGALGDILNPAISALVGVFASGAEEFGKFLGRASESREILRESRKAGEGLGSVLKDILGVVGLLGKGVAKLVNGTGGLVFWLNIMVKLGIVFKLQTKLLASYKAGVAAGAQAVSTLAVSQDIATKKFIVNNKAVLQSVGLLKGLALRYQAVSTSIRATTASQITNIKVWKGWGIIGTKAQILNLKLVGSFTAIAATIKSAGGAMVIFGAAVKGLTFVFLRLFAAIAVFEGVMWIIDRVFGADARAKETAKAISEMTTQLEAYMFKVISLQKILKDSEKSGGAIGLDLLGGNIGKLRSSVVKITQTFDRIHALTVEFNTSTNRKTREGIRERIEIEKQGFDRLVENARESYVLIEQLLADHEQAKVNIQTLFSKTSERVISTTLDKALAVNKKAFEEARTQFLDLQDRMKMITVVSNNDLIEERDKLFLTLSLLAIEAADIELKFANATARARLQIVKRAHAEELRLTLVQSRQAGSEDRISLLKAEATARLHLATAQTSNINLSVKEKLGIGALTRIASDYQAKLDLLNTQEELRLNKVESRKNLLNALITVEEKFQGTLDANTKLGNAELELSRAKVEAMRTEEDTLIALGGVEAQLHQDRLNRLAEIKQTTEDATNLDFMRKFIKGPIDALSNALDSLADAQARHRANQAKHVASLQKLFDDEKISASQHADLLLKVQKATNQKEKLEGDKQLLILADQATKFVALEAAKYFAKWGNAAGFALAAVALAAGAAVSSRLQQQIRNIDTDIAAIDTGFQAAIDEATRSTTAQAADTQSIRKLGGTIKAQNLDVTIAPVISISGEQIFIGSGSVTEFGAELQAILLQTMQQAIDTGEVDLSAVGNLQG